jgi:uncharacterized protein YndB with AHSA1/START domain
MSDANAQTGGSVETSIFIEARPQTVFTILSDPEQFSSWLDGEASFQLEAGSPFSVRFPQFSTVIEGEVAEVVKDQKIAFTWGVSEGHQAEWLPPGSTRLELVLAPEGEGTRVTLSHFGLPTDEEVQQHTAGWKFHLWRLQLVANRSYLAAILGSTIGTYFSAWSDTDADSRMHLLDACCAEDIEFKDEYAAFAGRDKLSLHIGSTQHFVPDATMELDGEVRICRGEVLIPWKAMSAEGEVLFRGINYALVSGDGALRRVVGFWGGEQQA